MHIPKILLESVILKAKDSGFSNQFNQDIFNVLYT